MKQLGFDFTTTARIYPAAPTTTTTPAPTTTTTALRPEALAGPLGAHDVRSIVAALAQHFGVRAPAVNWTARTRRALYYPTRQSITIGPRTWTGAEFATLHEFAHHLNHVQCNGGGHDSSFWACVIKIARAWYGDPAKYGWRYEYKTGKTLAQRKGWFTPAPKVEFKAFDPNAPLTVTFTPVKR
jgi:hypothetical protein